MTNGGFFFFHAILKIGHNQLQELMASTPLLTGLMFETLLILALMFLGLSDGKTSPLDMDIAVGIG